MTGQRAVRARGLRVVEPLATANGSLAQPGGSALSLFSSPADLTWPAPVEPESAAGGGASRPGEIPRGRANRVA